MRRSIRHWTPRYIGNRLLLEFHKWQRPDAPWLTKRSYQFLENWLTTCDEGLEWGSGRSTLWLAERVRKLTSVEHDARWHERIAAELRQRKLQNVSYHFASSEIPCDGSLPDYVRVGANLDETRLDFVLVDGLHRDLCAKVATTRLKPGGLLIIDNVERFFPHPTHVPGALRTSEPPSALWRELAQELGPWHCLWTTNGVWDTAIFTKPAAAAGRFQRIAA